MRPLAQRCSDCQRNYWAQLGLRRANRGERCYDVGEDAAGFVEEDAAEVHLEGFGIGGLVEGFFFGDRFGLDQFEEGLIEGLHAFVRAGLDGGGEFVEQVLLDEFPHGRRIDHDFDRGNDAARDGRDQPLTDDRAQVGGDLAADLVAFVRGEEIEGAADGRVRRRRVQRGDHEVAGVRRGERGHERLAVAHLADHDDIGILAHDVDERPLETQRVEADFALFDDGLFVLENVLDRVFQRDDVALLVFVDVLDHRGQRAGFAAARRARDEDDAALGFRDLAQLLGEIQLFEGRHLRFHVAHRKAEQSALVKDVDAEPAQRRVDVRKIRFLLALQPRLEMFRQHELDDFRDLLLRRGIDLHGKQFARDADRGVVIGFYMDVGGAHVDGEFEKAVKILHKS